MVMKSGYIGRRGKILSVKPVLQLTDLLPEHLIIREGSSAARALHAGG